MDVGVIIRFSGAVILPAAVAGVLYILNKKTAFEKLSPVIKQIIYGLVFGGIAILGTEFGVPLNGAQLNCRDAAVLTAGLLFGAPAGIIAGLIGGVERWIAVAWGVGEFTRVACSVATILAGVLSAIVRKVMFESKKPDWLLSFGIGMVTELLHLSLVFLTNIDQIEKAIQVVQVCTVPLIVGNSVSVMLSAIVYSILHKIFAKEPKRKPEIAQIIQRWMVITMFLAFLTTQYFVFAFQNRLAEKQTDSLLDLASDEIVEDIRDASDDNLLTLTHLIAKEVSFDNLSEIAEKYGVTEISIISWNGIITDSNIPEYLGFDMHSGPQAAEFLCLLGDTEEFVQEYGPITSNNETMRKYAGAKMKSGFVQVGYDAEAFQNDIDSTVIGITKNRHVGENGFTLILDEKKNVISAPAGISELGLKSQLSSFDFPGENTTFELTINSIDYFGRYHMAEGYYIISFLPCDEALQSRDISVYLNSYLENMVFAVLFFLIYMLLRAVVVNKIKKFNRSLGKITAGDLNEIVDVRYSDEFDSLSDDVNSTVTTLKKYIDEASARIDKELELAKNIQSSALPSTFPAFPKRKDFDIYASMDPAKEVGGDFYDFYMTQNSYLHFVVADVSGKGIPAAMFMMRAKTELKSLTEAGLPLSEVFTQGNSALCEGNDAGMFVTAWQGTIDLANGKVMFANAGHNPPLIKRGDGKFEYLKSRVGFVLAGMDGVPYRLQEFSMQPGDIIFLYTDGVTEAQNSKNELYGEDRLRDCINSIQIEDMKTLCGQVRSDVDKFVNGAPQFDDITMVALKFIGTPPAPSIHFDEGKIDDIPEVTEFVEAELEKLDCPMKTVIQINIAIDEIYSNIVRYGYKDHPGPVTVEVIERESPHGVSLRFTDDGIPYNPLKKEDPDVTLSAEDRNIGGLGIFMVKKSMDDMKYEYENDKNILTITKLF